jgi:hypothetical protein
MATNDIFDTDTVDVDVGDSNASPSRGSKEPAPVYRVYEGSRIAISSSVGKLWQRRINAAVKAYEQVAIIWDEVFKYYNNNQGKPIDSSRGMFKRGDVTENVVFSNLNIMLPAVYSKNPDITCSSSDSSEQNFCKALEKLINTLFRTKLRAKPRIKKCVGIGLLTNFGILKLDYTRKDDSREVAVQEMARITQALSTAKTQEEVSMLYGELEALEMNMEVMKPSGPSLSNVLPHNLIIDPYAEMQDGTDAEWQAERVFLPTAMLTQRFTKPDPESTSDKGDLDPGSRVLVYKPTHKAAFDTAQGQRDDGLGFVQQAMDAGVQSIHHTDDERTAYMNMFSTECYLIWDKATRRIMLFHRDDWSWPLWVWDDPLNISRFFPYFIVGYTMSTGGTVAVGETAYYLDQQDEINVINRKLRRMRTSVFDYFFYNADKTDSDQIEKMLNGMRGENIGSDSKHVLGIKAGEGKISDIFESLYPRMDQYKELFNKQDLFDSVNRISNTSDALRGVQFKTNTNEDAVNTYQESMKLSVGAKVDVVEDAVADIAVSLAELCVQYMTVDDVVGLIGPTLGQNYRQMTVDQLNSTYNLEIVAGSMEKPNSVFKKKEAVQIAQAVGQFAQAAPGATLKVMLKVLEQAFTEVVIQPEDWAAIDAEIQAKTGQGVGSSTGTQPGGNQPAEQPPGGAPAGSPAAPTPSQTQGPGAVPGQNIEQLLASIPPDVKAQVVRMKQQGADPHMIMSYLLQHVAALHAQAAGAPPGGVPQQSNGGAPPTPPMQSPKPFKPAPMKTPQQGSMQ